MKKMKRFAALALALGLTLTLGACNQGISTFDAKAYIEGMLKQTYLGEFDEGYLTLVDSNEEEAQTNYENSLDVESQFFCYFYDIEYPTDKQMEQLRDLYGRIYAHAKFEVVSAAKQDDGSFSVKLSIEPINIVQLAEAKLGEALEPFYTKYENADINNMTDEEYKAYDQEYAQIIIDTYESVMSEIGNEEVKTLSVQIEEDEDGYFGLADDDFDRIDALIINYDVSDVEGQ